MANLRACRTHQRCAKRGRERRRAHTARPMSRGTRTWRHSNHCRERRISALATCGDPTILVDRQLRPLCTWRFVSARSLCGMHGHRHASHCAVQSAAVYKYNCTPAKTVTWRWHARLCDARSRRALQRRRCLQSTTCLGSPCWPRILASLPSCRSVTTDEFQTARPELSTAKDAPTLRVVARSCSASGSTARRRFADKCLASVADGNGAAARALCATPAWRPPCCRHPASLVAAASCVGVAYKAASVPRRWLRVCNGAQPLAGDVRAAAGPLLAHRGVRGGANATLRTGGAGAAEERARDGTQVGLTTMSTELVVA
jgi:hypothetical protein